MNKTSGFNSNTFTDESCRCGTAGDYWFSFYTCKSYGSLLTETEKLKAKKRLDGSSCCSCWMLPSKW